LYLTPFTACNPFETSTLRSIGVGSVEYIGGSGAAFGAGVPISA
jgi:hypothetical protein